MIEIIFYGICVSLLITALLFWKNYILSRERMEKIKSFEHYIGVLDFHLKKAYELIYKDKLFIYSLEATKITDSQFQSYSLDFANLVKKLMGPILLKEFIDLYGEDAFMLNVIEYFNNNYESDEIRKTTQENLVNEEEEPNFETHTPLDRSMML